jgi:hypothetical protein
MKLSMIAAAAASLLALAGCAASTEDGDVGAPTDDEIKTTKSEDAFLMQALETAGVPVDAPAKGALGVSGSVHAKVFCSSPVVPHPIRHCQALAPKGGDSLGELADKDVAKFESILDKRGVAITAPPKGLLGSGSWRVADVSCQAVVAPGSPAHCTVARASL